MEHDRRTSDVIAERLAELRRERGWSIRRLAEVCADQGMPKLNQSVLANIEYKRRGYVTVDELLVLALAFGVAPIHLVVPFDDGVPVELPGRTVDAGSLRDWMVGRLNLDGSDVYWREQPPGWAHAREAAAASHAATTFAEILVKMLEEISVQNEARFLADYLTSVLRQVIQLHSRDDGAWWRREPPLLDDDLQQAALDDERRKGGVLFRDEQGRWWQDTPAGPVLVGEDADVERGIS